MKALPIPQKKWKKTCLGGGGGGGSDRSANNEKVIFSECDYAIIAWFVGQFRINFPRKILKFSVIALKGFGNDKRILKSYEGN